MYRTQFWPLVLILRRAEHGSVMTTLSRLRVDLLLLVVAASWGSLPATKQLVTPSSVLALLAARMLLAAVIMGGTVAVARRRSRSGGRPARREVRVGVILGVLLAAVFACETFGVAHTSATNAGLIISLTVGFTPI